jgi:hypothetical protein
LQIVVERCGRYGLPIVQYGGVPVLNSRVAPKIQAERPAALRCVNSAVCGVLKIPHGVALMPAALVVAVRKP